MSKFEVRNISPAAWQAICGEATRRWIAIERAKQTEQLRANFREAFAHLGYR